MIPNIFDNPMVLKIGWALLHFLWQGIVIALALKGALIVVERSFSRFRYALALISLFLMTSLPVFVLCKPQRNYSDIPATHETVQVKTASATNSTTASIPNHNKLNYRNAALRLAEPLVPWIAAGWIFGMALLLFKTVGGVVQVKRLKRKATTYCETHSTESFQGLAVQAKMAGVPILKSNLVSVPTVAGWLKPVVLLPKDILEKLDRPMLDALVAHELAHIRRQDSIMNLLQTVIEDMLFFHPAMWWVSRCVRAEREACCDDDAVSICGDALVYMRALSKAEQFRSSLPVMALSSSPLLQRIRRLTEMRISKTNQFKAFCIALLAVSFIISMAAGSVLLATIPPQNASSNVSTNTQSDDRDSPKNKARSKPRAAIVDPNQFVAPPKPAPNKDGKGNIVGGIPGGISGGISGRGPVPPPPSKVGSKPRVALVDPNQFVAPPKPAPHEDGKGNIVGGIPCGIVGGVVGGVSGGGPVLPPPVVTSENSNASTIEALLTQKKALLKQYQSRFTSKHPEVVKLQREVDDLEKKVAPQKK
jgi:beta-lactamase regulating signal transducer with metallopeptidase domain